MSYALVGNPNITRRDIPAKTTGKAVFATDINPTHIAATTMWYMGAVTSPYASAKIVSIDTSQVEAAGYVAVTSEDLPAGALMTGSSKAVPALPSGEATFSGQIIAAVGAPSPKQVDDALDLIKVQLESLPFVLDAEEALQPGAVEVQPPGNLATGVAPSYSTVLGDTTTAIANADAVVTMTIETEPQQHFDIEPWSDVIWWTGGNLYIWAANKAHSSATERTSMSNYFGIPINNVIFRTGLGGIDNTYYGMTLGNKGCPEEFEFVAAVMAQKIGAPVKYGPTRYEHALNTTSRFAVRGYVTVAGTSDGTFTAIEATLYENAGAVGSAEGSDTVSDLVQAYVVPNINIQMTCVSTNATHQTRSQRDVGESQGHFIMEVAVDQLAKKLGMDPAQFRLQNMRTAATAVDPTTGYKYSGLGMPQAFVNAQNAFNWSSLWKGWGVPVSVSGTKRTGVGVSILNIGKGSPGTCVGQVQVNTNGTVECITTCVDPGGGDNTVLPIMTAEALGLTSLTGVSCSAGDSTIESSTGPQPSGSQGTRTMGLATISAVANLASQWFPTVAAKLAPGTKASNLAFKNNTIYDTTNPSNQMSFTAAAALLTAPIKGMGSYTLPSKTTYRVAGGKFVEVEVDVETADVQVVSYAGGIDIGKVIFPNGAVSQARSGMFQGIGQAKWENFWYDPSTGTVLNADYLNYKIPTIMESPASVSITWDEYVDPVAPYGGKGIGEPCLCGFSAAFANALSNALGGYVFTKVPIEREDIVAAIQWMNQNGVS